MYMLSRLIGNGNNTGYGDESFSQFFGAFQWPLPVRCNWIVFARKMHSTTKFAITVLSKSVCVQLNIYLYIYILYSVYITIYVCKWWCTQFYVDIGWQIDNSVTALNPAWYFSETRTVAEILVACRMGYRHPWQHQLKNEPTWVSMQFPIMRTYSWTATYHWTEHPYKQESALRMNV